MSHIRGRKKKREKKNVAPPREDRWTREDRVCKEWGKTVEEKKLKNSHIFLWRIFWLCWCDSYRVLGTDGSFAQWLYKVWVPCLALVSVVSFPCRVSAHKNLEYKCDRLTVWDTGVQYLRFLSFSFSFALFLPPKHEPLSLHYKPYWDTTLVATHKARSRDHFEIENYSE